MSNWLIGFFDRAFAVVGALACAQAPMFIQQYGHQLSGRVAELKLQVQSIEYSASLGQKSLEQYVQRFLESGDLDFARQGELMQRMTERYNVLSIAINELNSATVISKPFIFIKEFNWDIASSTFSQFQPGIPFTFEGLIYAIAGIALGYGLFALFMTIVRLCYKCVVGPFKRERNQISDGA